MLKKIAQLSLVCFALLSYTNTIAQTEAAKKQIGNQKITKNTDDNKNTKEEAAPTPPQFEESKKSAIITNPDSKEISSETNYHNMAPIAVDEVPHNEDYVYSFIDQVAEFPGGQAEMYKWLQNTVEYPKEARKNNIQGKIIVRFIIEKDGSIDGITVVRGVNELLDAEAIRIAKAMPKWSPAKLKGKIVRSYVALPVVFKLENTVIKQ